jgi:hypothetical protein
MLVSQIPRFIKGKLPKYTAIKIGMFFRHITTGTIYHLGMASNHQINLRTEHGDRYGSKAISVDDIFDLDYEECRELFENISRWEIVDAGFKIKS